MVDRVLELDDSSIGSQYIVVVASECGVCAGVHRIAMALPLHNRSIASTAGRGGILCKMMNRSDLYDDSTYPRIRSTSMTTSLLISHLDP